MPGKAGSSSQGEPGCALLRPVRRGGGIDGHGYRDPADIFDFGSAGRHKRPGLRYCTVPGLVPDVLVQNNQNMTVTSIVGAICGAGLAALHRNAQNIRRHLPYTFVELNR